MPQTMAIIIAVFLRERRGAALDLLGGVAALATIAGPTVGGVLVTWKGWRWIFFVNIPLGIIAIDPGRADHPGRAHRKPAAPGPARRAGSPARAWSR